MLKKTTSLLMALLLCTALLLGCGQETTNSSQGDSSAESSSDAASSGADSGDSVSSYPLVDKTVTFNAVNTKSENVEESAACKAYEEITNVHINWTYWSMNDFVQNLTLAVTADTVPDILFNMVSNGTQGCTPSQINQWGNAGYFVNYMDYEDLIPDVLAALKESSRAAVSCYTDDGKMFLLPTWNWSYTGVGINLYYYTELAKEIGYNAPPETIDEFYDMLVKAQAEFGATDDEFYAYRAGSATAELEANYVFTAFGDFVQTGYDSIDLKTVEYAGMSDQMKAYLQFCAKCYAAGVIDPNCYSSDSTANAAAIKGMKCLVTPYQPFNYSWDTFNGVLTADEISAYQEAGTFPLETMLPLTSDQDGKTIRVKNAVVGAGSNLCISSKCSDIETAVKWMNGWYADDVGYEGWSHLSAWLGIENVDWGYEDDAKTVYWTDKGDSEIGFSNAPNRVFYALPSAANGNEGQHFYAAAQKVILDNYSMEPDEMFNVSMLTLNDDENEVIASYGADISTYVKEAIPKFIMGVWNFDTDWTAYVAQLKTMGIEKCVAAYQAALDRYNEKWDQYR